MTVSPNDTLACDNETITFTDHITGCPGAYVIYWKDGFQYRDTTYSPDSTWVTTLPAGVRQIWSTVDCNPNGFDDADIIYMNVDDCSGIEEYENGTLITLYPNPSSGNIIIDTRKLMMNPSLLSVFDMKGNVVRAAYEIESHFALLTADQFNDGIYYFRITDKDGKKSATGKFVISKITRFRLPVGLFL
jgi:hypothetical protein